MLARATGIEVVHHGTDGRGGIHEALGFTHIGTYPDLGFKHGQWHDVGYWRKALQTATPPAEIVVFSEARGNVKL